MAYMADGAGGGGRIWAKRVQKAEKFMEKAITHGAGVYARYQDNRENELTTGSYKRVNFFYANVNTIKESLFNSLPQPDVSRMHKGNFDDDAARVAALIVSRGLAYEIQNAKDFSGALKAAILDRLVPGIGQLWFVFEVDKETGLDPFTGEEVESPVAGSERIVVDQVYWEDFIYEPARCWEKVGWAGRRLELSKEEVVTRWGEAAAQDIEAYVAKQNNNLSPKEISQDKYCVYELWDKKKREVVFWAKGMDEPLETKPDPYNLRDFYPFPPPLIANPTTAAFLPVTDYHLAQDQYLQLDTLYARISLIIEAIKVAGCYNAASTEIGRMLEGQENKLIPVDNWAIYAEQGGAKGMIDWFPVEQVVTVLQQLQAQFEAIKGVLQEVSGMSDIMRGASNQYETAKAQQIKAQFASVRMNGYQRDVAEFVSGMLGIMAEMMVQLYGDEKLQAIVGSLDQADVVHVPSAVEILRNDFMSQCRVSIKADSLVQSDWALEKGQRMELMGFISQFMQSAMPAVQQAPELGRMLLSLMKWTITGFRGSAEVEGVIDQQLDLLVRKEQEAARNPQPKEPSPEEIKAQADMQKQQMEMARAERESQAQMRLEEMQAMADIAVARNKAQVEAQLAQMNMAHEQQLNRMEQQMMEMKLAFEERKQSMQLQTAAAKQSMSNAEKPEDD